MLYVFAVSIGVAVLGCGVACFTAKRISGGRVRALEQDLQRFSEAMNQMAEMQMKTYRKLSANLQDIEERLLDLSVPKHDSTLPLERRHNVLALARKGASVDDIAQRIGIPRGEAELIVGLSNYLKTGPSRTARAANEVKSNAQA